MIWYNFERILIANYHKTKKVFMENTGSNFLFIKKTIIKFYFVKVLLNLFLIVSV